MRTKVVTLIISKNGEIIDEFDLVDVVGVFNYLKNKLMNQNFDKKLARTLIKDCTFAIKKLEKGTVKGIETMLTTINSEIKEGILHSTIGHEQLANILNVPLNRTTVELKNDDTAIVAQYRGPRLEEGAKILPEGAAIEFYFVKVNKG